MCIRVAHLVVCIEAGLTPTLESEMQHATICLQGSAGMYVCMHGLAVVTSYTACCVQACVNFVHDRHCSGWPRQAVSSKRSGTTASHVKNGARRMVWVCIPVCMTGITLIAKPAALFGGSGGGAITALGLTVGLSQASASCIIHASWNTVELPLLQAVCLASRLIDMLLRHQKPLNARQQSLLRMSITLEYVANGYLTLSLCL